MHRPVALVPPAKLIVAIFVQWRKLDPSRQAAHPRNRRVLALGQKCRCNLDGRIHMHDHSYSFTQFRCLFFFE